jgi:hypothetical protein
MPAEVVDAVIGIDTHRDTHEVEIADAAGKPITVAWACRNCRQVGPVRRGAGSVPAACGISQMVDGATVTPSFLSSPWIRRCPRSGFSFARRTARRAILWAVGHRPGHAPIRKMHRDLHHPVRYPTSRHRLTSRRRPYWGVASRLPLGPDYQATTSVLRLPPLRVGEHSDRPTVPAITPASALLSTVRRHAPPKPRGAPVSFLPSPSAPRPPSPASARAGPGW